jgi:hypothetical protein
MGTRCPVLVSTSAVANGSLRLPAAFWLQQQQQQQQSSASTTITREHQSRVPSHRHSAKSSMLSSSSSRLQHAGSVQHNVHKRMQTVLAVWLWSSAICKFNARSATAYIYASFVK